jgi:inosine/xanthosine triphosphate pyrophosphatase family protein
MIIQDARMIMEDAGIAIDEIGIVPGDFSEEL